MAVELDTDGNGAIDINLGGTNAKTAGEALSNLGGQPYDADLDILSSGSFSQKRALIEAFAKPVLGVDALRTTMADFDGDCRYLAYHTASGDGGHGTFRWDATSTAADDNGVTIAVTGVATGRWIREFTGPILVEFFGGGTGVANNSIAMQAAYTAGYRYFKFGTGTYTFTDGFTFTDPIFIEGSGSKSLDHPNFGTVLYYTGSDDFITIDLATTRRGGKISNLRIEATNTTNKIFKLVDCWRFEVDHCDIVGGGYGFYVDGLSFSLMLHNTVIQSYNIAGLYCGTQTTDVTVDTCDFGCNADSTAWGIITNGVNTKITKSWFEVGPGTRPTGSGGHIIQPSTAPLNAGCTITQNEFGRVGTNASNHIRIEGGQYAIITGNAFVGSTSPTSSLIYYDLSVIHIGYRSSMVSQNKFMNFVSPAIQVNLGVIDISHNDFFTTDTLLTGTYFIDDVYNTSSKIRVIGNNFACDASSAIYAVKGCGTTGTPQIVSFNDNNIYNMGGSEGYVSIANGNRIDGGASKLAVGINVRDGAITGNRIRNCSKAIMARNCTVIGNYLDGNTVTIEPYTADGLYPLIANNSGDIQTVTTSSATITRYGTTHIDTTSGPLTGAIGNGFRPGDIKLFSVLTYNGDYTLTVNNHEGAGAVTFVFGSATASLSLMWDGATWVTLRDGTGL